MSFTNRNICKSHSIALNGTQQPLSGGGCSEVIVIGTASTTVRDIYGGNLVVPQDTVFTFRGVTDSTQLSAAGSGTLYYRTQYFGSITPIAS